MRTAITHALIMWTATLGAGLHAQGSAAPVASSFCLFRTAPAPRCDQFLITEFAIHPRGTVEGEGPATYLTWEGGMMVNRDENAWGGALFVGVDGQAGTRIGMKGRYRRWLGPSMSIDVGAGLLFMRFDGSWDPFYVPSLTGSAAINITNSIAFDLIVEDVVYRDPGVRHHLTVFPGLRVGGMPGLVTTALLFALVGVVAAGGGIGAM
jgi:hypothetical protein